MKDETNIPLGIAYLHSTIIIIFNVIAYLLSYLFTSADYIYKPYVSNFLTVFSIFALVLIVLFTLNKKRGQSLFTAFKDNTSRKTIGALILAGSIITIFLSVPALINSISQIINNNNDGERIPNIIYFMQILCPIVIALYFLKCKDKTGGDSEYSVVFGVPFFCIFINACFSLLEEFTLPIVSHSPFKLYFFIWFFSTLLVLIALFLIMRKRNQGVIATFQNRIVRKATGILVIISGIIEISSILNSLFASVWLIDFLGGMDSQAQLDIVLEIVRLIIYACEIVLGVFILKIKTNNISNENLG